MRSKVFAPLGSLSLLVLALGSGCPENTPVADAAMTADSGGGSDTGATMDDAGTPTEDAPAVDEVARCTATAAMVATACGGQADRTCEHTQGGMRCATERADVLADAYQCLLDASMGSCRTFSDPSAADTCLAALAGETTLTAAGEGLVTDILALCTDTTRGQLIAGGVVPIMALSDATIGRIDTCVGSATDCAGVQACFFTEFAPIVACYE